MARFSDLAPELLEIIFHGLGSIDDVHHFARACRATFGVIQSRHIYTKIMRTIISNSPHHRYDMDLCRMLLLHNQVVQHWQIAGSIRSIRLPPWDPSGRRPQPVTDIEIGLGEAISFDNQLDVFGHQVLTEERIYDILARWQGLRPLRDLWLQRQLTDADYFPINDRSDAEDFSTAFNAVRQLDDYCHQTSSPARLSPAEAHYTSFNPDQNGRFHAAITRHWVMNEIRWVLTNFDGSGDMNIPLEMLDICMERLDKKICTPILDDLDQFSVYTFLYQHLLPLHSHALANQSSSQLPFTFSPSLDQPISEQEHLVWRTRYLQFFLMSGQTYLQPPDIIDLVVRNQVNRRQPSSPVHLPASTRKYIAPSFFLTFRPNIYSRTTNGFCPEPFLATDSAQRQVLRCLITMQRCTFTQSPGRADPTAHRHPGGLYILREYIEDWLKNRILTQYDPKTAERGLSDIRVIFDENWKEHVRWQVWWWANGEEKCRMKMKRWGPVTDRTRVTISQELPESTMDGAQNLNSIMAAIGFGISTSG